MKHGRNPTRAQKQAISAARLNPDNWLIHKVYSDRLELIHRHTNNTKQVEI